MPFSARTVRLLTRITISSIVLIFFAMHIAGSPRFEAIDRMENYLYDVQVRGRELQLLREVLATGANGNYLDYISAEQAFMAVQMLVIELDNPYLEDQLDRIADTLNNDERYRPSQFAAMLAALAEPEPEAENIDERDE